MHAHIQPQALGATDKQVDTSPQESAQQLHTATATASATGPRSSQPKKEAPWPTLFPVGHLPDDPQVTIIRLVTLQSSPTQRQKESSTHMLDVDTVVQGWHLGAVLVDKPLGWTSFDVCGKLRGALKIKKVLASHAPALLFLAVRFMNAQAQHLTRHLL